MDTVSLAAGFADALAASTVMRSFIEPLILGLSIAASLGCTLFLVIGGMQYMSSRGSPENLEHAKRTIKNALIGLAFVIAAATLTAILVHAYSSSAGTTIEKLPTLAPIQDKPTNFWNIVIQTIIHVLQDIISSIGQPFVQALEFFTKSTPLMGDNSAVFNMWLVMVGIADVLFILVVALLGFQVMSFSTLGFEELEIKSLLPQLALAFLLMNTSLFAIDGVISISNVMVHALQSAFPPMTLWDLLTNMTKQSSGMGLGALLIMIAFLVLTVLLLVYYVFRLITLYIGAALSPLIVLLYLLPAFRDFAITAAKIYFMNIFVLFVQVVIMLLASSIFEGMLEGTNSGQPNTLMALIVGVATVWALLKTPGVMKELSFAASFPRSMRQLGVNLKRGYKGIYKTADSSVKTYEKYKKAQEKNKKARAAGGGTGSGRQPSYEDAPPLQTGQTRRAPRFSATNQSFEPEAAGFRAVRKQEASEA